MNSGTLTRDNPLYSYARHWLTLQAVKLAGLLQLPETGRAQAIDYAVEAAMLALFWLAAKYGAPVFKRFVGARMTLSLVAMAGAGAMVSGCGTGLPLELGATADGCVTLGATVQEGRVVKAAICADGRKYLEWETRTAEGERIVWRGTIHADGRKELGYHAGDQVIRWDEKSGLQVGWVPEELRETVAEVGLRVSQRSGGRPDAPSAGREGANRTGPVPELLPPVAENFPSRVPRVGPGAEAGN